LYYVLILYLVLWQVEGSVPRLRRCVDLEDYWYAPDWRVGSFIT